MCKPIEKRSKEHSQVSRNMITCEQFGANWFRSFLKPISPEQTYILLNKYKLPRCVTRLDPANKWTNRLRSYIVVYRF